MKRLVITCGLFVAAVSPIIRAEEGRPMARGTAGLVAVPFRAENAGPGDLTCSVALAHWYSQALGTAAPGSSVVATLWSDPRDGDVLLLNDLEDHMPVQMLWCGDWSRRAVVRLQRNAGTAPAPIRVTCRSEGGGLACR